MQLCSRRAAERSVYCAVKEQEAVNYGPRYKRLYKTTKYVW